ncbi:MAG: membrane dipeptidase [Thermodesulfobacteriota bacterium]
MDRREFLRLSAAAGAALAGGGIFSGCDLEDLALQGVRIVDPHAHPDQFYLNVSEPADKSSLIENIVGVGMVASSFAAIGDLQYLSDPATLGAGEHESTKYQISLAQKLADDGKVKKVLKTADIPYAIGVGVLPGAIFAVEGGDPLTSGAVGADPQYIADRRIDEYYALGVRIFQLLHYRHNDLGDAQSTRIPSDPRAPYGGLRPLGAHVVARLQEKGILVDVAHADANTVRDIAEIAQKPVIDSHTGLRPETGETPSRRLRTWEEMEDIAGTGGVVCSWPFAWQTDSASRLTLAEWARELVLMKQRLGIAHVGIGTDGGGGLPAKVEGYAGVQDLGALALALRKAGMSQGDVKAVLGGNVLRVLKECIG